MTDIRSLFASLAIRLLRAAISGQTAQGVSIDTLVDTVEAAIANLDTPAPDPAPVEPPLADTGTATDLADILDQPVSTSDVPTDLPAPTSNVPDAPVASPSDLTVTTAPMDLQLELPFEDRNFS